MDHLIVIHPNGNCVTLYTDRIDLREIGTLDVKRASNVEYDHFRQGWIVIFQPEPPANTDVYLQCVGDHSWQTGSLLHASVFPSRENALAAEVAYLQSRL